MLLTDEELDAIEKPAIEREKAAKTIDVAPEPTA